MAQPHITRGVWRFTLIWLGQLVSGIGSGLTNFILGIWVYQQTGSVTKFTLIFLFGSLPGALILPLAGVLVDRWDRRSMMILTNLGAGFSKFVLVLLLYTHRLEIWHIYLVVIAVSTFGSFQGITYTTITTLLVPKQHYGRASGMIQAAQAAAQIVPPFLAALMIGAINIQGIILVDVVTYLWATAMLLMVRLPRPQRADAVGGRPSRRPLWREVVYGWTYIQARPGLLGLLVYFAAVNFAVGSTTVLFTPMALGFASSQTLGMILSISGVGFLSGSLLMSLWGGPRSRVHGVLGFGLLFGCCSILAGLRPSATLIAVAGFGMFFVLPVVNGCSQAIWQSKTPLNVQGRVFAVRRLIGASAIPLAYLLAGPLADRLFEPLVNGGHLSARVGQLIGQGKGRGIALMFIIAGVLILLAQVGGYLYPRLRQVEEELPDAPAEVVLSET